MARTVARRPDVEDEEEMLDDEVEELDDVEEAQAVAPAVSDRRRRRMAKRGELPTEEEEAEKAVVQSAGKDRPTPSQREETRPANFLVRIVRDFRTYLQETRAELRKVAWLNREDLMRLTWIVITVTAIAAIFLGAVSFLFSFLTTQIATVGSSTFAGLVAIAIIIAVAGGWLLRDRIFGPHIE